jgi:ATP-binding cassette subfamily B protein
MDKRLKGFLAELRLTWRRARQVWRLVPAQHKWALGIATMVIAGVSICNTLLPILLGHLVDDVKDGSDTGLPQGTLLRMAAGILLLVACVYTVRELLNVLRRYLVENACTRINRDMSVRLIAHLLRQRLESLGQEKVGTLHGRIFRCIDGFVRFVRLGFLDFFPPLLTGAMALLTALSKQPLIALPMMGVIPLAVYFTVWQLLSQKKVRLRLIRACEEIDGAVVEQLGGVEYIRAANTPNQEVKRVYRACEQRRAREVKHHFQMSLFGCAKALNEGLFHILVLGMAVYLAISGQISYGSVLTFSMLFLNVMTPLSEIHRVIDEGHDASLRVGELLDMLAVPIDPSFETTTKRFPRVYPGEPVIEIDDLHVQYTTPDGRDRLALDGVSLAIRHGETIGIAGRSGSGKSTWVKVILRLVHAQTGRVRLASLPLEEMSREEIGRLFGYVGQLPFVFAGTIAENIAYGNGAVTRAQIEEAAMLAHLHDEILLLPRGYDAEVTERGQNLSGGQRQRLAIARILLKQAPILILDEATSALDNISERLVQRALGLTSADRTTILVAHRLTTLRDADRIFVFDGGKIVETGSYNELVQRGGVFTELILSAEQGVTEQGGATSPPAREEADGDGEAGKGEDNEEAVEVCVGHSFRSTPPRSTP